MELGWSWDGAAPCSPKWGGFAPKTALGCPYSYEVQLESQVRRRGLGKFLLQILQLVANR